MSSGNKALRLRIFAGPNGSGKSLIINTVRNTTINGFPLDVGIYINADDIVRLISKDEFNFSEYSAEVTKKPFLDFAEKSGLVDNDLPLKQLQNGISIYQSKLSMKTKLNIEKLAQLIARFLREALLISRKRFSFETVFSHSSNIEFMERARDQGYKIYLYYVATEDPAINEYRIDLRVRKGGHAVPENKIAPRYYRSLSLLYDAAELAYQAFFFDNSRKNPELINHFKSIDGVKYWDYPRKRKYPSWFKKYYWDKKQ